MNSNTKVKVNNHANMIEMVSTLIRIISNKKTYPNLRDSNNYATHKSAEGWSQSNKNKSGANF